MTTGLLSAHRLRHMERRLPTYPRTLFALPRMGLATEWAEVHSSVAPHFVDACLMEHVPTGQRLETKPFFIRLDVDIGDCPFSHCLSNCELPWRAYSRQSKISTRGGRTTTSAMRWKSQPHDMLFSMLQLPSKQGWPERYMKAE